MYRLSLLLSSPSSPDIAILIIIFNVIITILTRPRVYWISVLSDGYRKFTSDRTVNLLDQVLSSSALRDDHLLNVENTSIRDVFHRY